MKTKRVEQMETGDLVIEAIRDKEPHAASRRRRRELELARRCQALVHKGGLLIVVGVQMSNLCFNLGQAAGRVLSESDAKAMRDLARQWDAAIVGKELKL